MGAVFAEGAVAASTHRPRTQDAAAVWAVGVSILWTEGIRVLRKFRGWGRAGSGTEGSKAEPT